MIYRASQDDFGSHDFHTKCDEHKQTLTILRDKKSGFIFGGYTHETWSSSGYKWDPGAFIFILTNRENKPCKMNIKQGAAIMMLKQRDSVTRKVFKLRLWGG